MAENRKCTCNCTLFGIIGLLIGITLGALAGWGYSFIFEAFEPAALIAIVAIAAAFLVIFVIALAFSSCNRCAAVKNCLQCGAGWLLLGIIGTIVFGIASLAIVEFLSIPLLNIILVGFTVGFFVLALYEIIIISICLLRSREREDCQSCIGRL